MLNNNHNIGFFLILLLFIPVNGSTTFQPSITTDQYGGLDVPGWSWSDISLGTEQSTSSSIDIDTALDYQDNIHLVWRDQTEIYGAEGDFDIFYKSYSIKDNSWSSSELVSTDSTADSYRPSIAVDGQNNVHVAWTDTTNMDSSGSDVDIFYKRLDSKTNTWQDQIVISENSTETSSRVDIDANHNNNVVITWLDGTDIDGAGTDDDIFYRTFNADTQSWSAQRVVSTKSSQYPLNNEVVIDEFDNIHVVWADSTNLDSSGSDIDIQYKKYIQSSNSWSREQIISFDSTEKSENAVIALDSKLNIHIAWEDLTDYAGSSGDRDIFYSYFNQETQSWSSTEVISDGIGSAENPRFSVDRYDNVHLVWEDHSRVNGASIYSDVFYKVKRSDQSYWDNEIAIPVNTPEISHQPMLETDNAGQIHIIWRESLEYGESGSDQDIYHIKYSGTPPRVSLTEIEPKPSTFGEVKLSWYEVYGAEEYNIYRSTDPITDTAEMTPIATTTDVYYFDQVDASGGYYYAVAASNIVGEGSMSNIEYVEVFLDTDQINSSNNTVTDTVTEESGFADLPIHVWIVPTTVLLIALVRRKNQ